MIRGALIIVMLWLAGAGSWQSSAAAQSASTIARPKFDAFEVASIKAIDVQKTAGRYFRMDGPHRWLAHNYSLEGLIALAYDLNPRTISSGPEWMHTQLFEIAAVTPGEETPTRLEQMRMLRALLVERFALKFHRQDKEMSVYELSTASGGPKLGAAAKQDDAADLMGVVYPDRLEVTARSATMDDFVAMLQRATLDRPTLNRTALSGRYDFVLKFAQDETVYGGALPKATEDSQFPPLFTAIQEQLGLKLTATRGTVSTMVIDSVQKPSAD